MPCKRLESMEYLPNPQRNLRPALLLASVCLFLTTMGLAAPPLEPLILGVHPYLSYPEIKARFRPLAHLLANRLKRPVEVRVGSSYAEHVDHVGKDDIDIAYLGPAPYVKLVELYGKKPLLARLERNGKAVLDGHIVVRRDSPVRRLEDLHNKSFGLGDPDSTMSSVIPLTVLEQAGVNIKNSSQLHRFRGHTNIALAVLSGRIEAGAVKSEVYKHYARQGLRSIQRLPEVPEHLFVARADMQDSLLEAIRSLLRSLHTTPQGRSILRSLHRDATALGPLSDNDYDSLRLLLSK